MATIEERIRSGAVPVREGEYGERVAAVEPGGVEYIPDSERHGRPLDLFWTWVSPNMEFATVFVGVLSIAFFGMGFVDASIAIILGTALGCVTHGILSSWGPKFGVPQMVQARGAFGFLGNILPAGLNAFTANIGWFIVNSVSGAFALQTLFGALVLKWFELPFWLAFLIIVLVQVVVAFFGHNLVHRFERFAFPYLTVVFLIACGLSLVYGVMRIVNMAHGNLYAFGAYVAAWTVGLVAVRLPDVNAIVLFVLLLAGALAAAAAGAVLEPTLLRPLYKRAEEYQLLMTFGLLLVLEDVMRLLWGPHPLTASVVADALPSVSLLGLTYPGYNLFVIVIGGVAALALWAFVYRTRFGVMLRATSQDMRMASALGINVKRVYVQAFTIGCLMAGLGGAVVMPISGAVLGMGVDALILAFVVVVIGGLGSLEGALVGALIVGFVRTLGIMYFAEVELAVLYLIAAIVLFVRPAGLFARA